MSSSGKALVKWSRVFECNFSTNSNLCVTLNYVQHIYDVCNFFIFLFLLSFQNQNKGDKTLLLEIKSHHPYLSHSLHWKDFSLNRFLLDSDLSTSFFKVWGLTYFKEVKPLALAFHEPWFLDLFSNIFSILSNCLDIRDMEFVKESFVLHYFLHINPQ